jgi:hypothetical protein
MLVRTQKSNLKNLLTSNLTGPQHSALPTLTKVAQISDTSIPGIAPQRVQPKRKAAEDLDADDDRVPKAATLNMGNDALSNLISDDEDDADWTASRHRNTQQSEALAHTNDDINIIDIRSTSSVIPVLRIGVWLPSVTGREHWQPLDHLSGSGGYDIHAKFMTHFAFNDAKQATYGAVARNANSHSDGGRCLNITVWQKGKGQSTFEKADGNQWRACDTCIRTKRLCVRIQGDSLGAKLCVMPLPESRREGRAMESIAVWVVG